MTLTKLTTEFMENINSCNHKIYLIDFSEKYFEELLAKCDIKENIAGILAERKNRIYGSLKNGNQQIIYHEKIFPVYSYEYFNEILDDATFIILNDYFEETYKKISDIGNSDKSQSTIYFFVNHETEIDLLYREKYKNDPLENIILFRSGPHQSAYVKGMDYADNARALFEYMLSEGYHTKYELIWLVKNPVEFSFIEQKYDNVKFVSFDWSTSDIEDKRIQYYRPLCLAKYIFMTDAYGFCRNARKDQIRVQLWHGCGFKTRINFIPCERRYEYNIVISEIYKKIHKKIYGLREDQVLLTGYPKDDWLFHQSVNWNSKLNVPKARKYIFWLPTFRKAVRQLNELDEKTPEGQTGLPIIQSIQQLQELDVFLHKKDVLLIIKPHPFQDMEFIYKGFFKNIVLLDNNVLVEKNIQINQILGYADGLISDYSSAAIDFLLMDKPIAFTLDDIDTYEENRGFVFKPIKEWLPGNELYSYSDFTVFIDNIVCNKDNALKKRRMLTKKFHKFYDDQSSRRVIQALGIS